MGHSVLWLTMNFSVIKDNELFGNKISPSGVGDLRLFPPPPPPPLSSLDRLRRGGGGELLERDRLLPREGGGVGGGVSLSFRTVTCGGIVG